MDKRRKKVKPMKESEKKERAKDEVNGQGRKGGYPGPTQGQSDGNFSQKYNCFMYMLHVFSTLLAATIIKSNIPVCSCAKRMSLNCMW